MYVHVRKEIRLSAGHQWHPEDAAVSPGCQWRPEDTVSPGYRGILRIPCPDDTGACPGIRCPQDTAPYPGHTSPLCRCPQDAPHVPGRQLACSDGEPLPPLIKGLNTLDQGYPLLLCQRETISDPSLSHLAATLRTASFGCTSMQRGPLSQGINCASLRLSVLFTLPKRESRITDSPLRGITSRSAAPLLAPALQRACAAVLGWQECAAVLG